MNLLPIVFMFMLVFSYFLLFFSDAFFKNSVVQTHFETLMKTRHTALAMRERYLFHTYIQSGKNSSLFTFSPHPESGRFRDRITQNSKLNFLPYLNNPSSTIAKKYVENLLDELYRKTSLAPRLGEIKGALYKKVLDLSKNGQTGSVRSITDITFTDARTQDLWNALQDGKVAFMKTKDQTGDTWEKLSDYLTIRPGDERLFCLCKAHYHVLVATLGERGAAAVLEIEKEHRESKKNATKEKLSWETKWNLITNCNLPFDPVDIRKAMHFRA